MNSTTSANAFRIKAKAISGGFRYYLRRLTGKRPSSLADVAYRSFSVSPSGRIPAIRPIIWPEHLPRIRGAAIGLDLEMLLGNIHREYFEFAQVDVHQIRNVTLIDGAMYSSRYRVQLAWPHKSIWQTRIVEPYGEVREASLAATMTGSRWFGHWIWDELPMQALVAAYGQPVAHLRANYFHESGIRKAVGAEEPIRLGTAYLQELTVATDPPVSPHKTRRLFTMREQLARLPAGQKRIFLTRGQDGEKRALVNEVELAEILERAGFKTFSSEGKSFDQVLHACNGAETLVTVEGSHATPAFLFMRPGGRLVILNPPYRSSTILPDLGLFVGLRGGMFVCEPAGDSLTEFVADPEEVLRFIEHVEAIALSSQGELDGFVEQLLQHK